MENLIETNKAKANTQLEVKMATRPLSDKTIETDPDKAATWLLQYDNAVEPILRMGEKPY